MLEKLKKHYGSSFVFSSNEPENYQWFIHNDGKRFGIHKSKLSRQEKALLETLFIADASISTLTPEQLQWKEILSGCVSIRHKVEPFRFLHFFCKTPLNDRDAFLEAISGLFPSNVVVLFETNKNGVIIESFYTSEEEIPYEQIKDVITSDFYTDLDLFFGKWQDNYSLAGETYKVERDMFLTVQPFLPPQMFYREADLLPYLLLSTATKEIKRFIRDLLDPTLKEDSELLHSIKVFLECNMNSSLAAKKLYIHRNSLQYRVDKFIEKTGIDVKQFVNALAVYHAILFLEIENTTKP